MDSPSRSDAEVRITRCADGPLLVRGDVTVIGPDGDELPRARRTIALCRWGRTGISPSCDGSHKLALARPRPGAGS